MHIHKYLMYIYGNGWWLKADNVTKVHYMHMCISGIEYYLENLTKSILQHE